MQIRDLLLEQREIVLRFEPGSNRALVELPVGLRAGRAHRRPLARIERSKLDAGAISRERHRTAERVDFLDQMAFADAADRRIAAHLAERLDVMREQQRAGAHARGRQCRFGAGVSAADHDHVESFGEAHGVESNGYFSEPRTLTRRRSKRQQRRRRRPMARRVPRACVPRACVPRAIRR